MRCRFGSLSIAVTALALTAPLSATAVTLTFDTVSNTNGVVVTNIDGSTYLNELAAGIGPTPVSGPGNSTLGNGSWLAASTASRNHLTVYRRNVAPGSAINEAAFTGYGAGTANIRLRDIESFSFDTKKPSGPSDWYVQIYTLQDTLGGYDSGQSGFLGPNGDDSGSFYGRRITFEPTYAYNQIAPNNVWNNFSTDGPTNQLGFFDHNGPASTFVGYNGEPTLDDLQSGPINWADGSEGDMWPASGYTKGGSGSSATVDYADEIIFMLRVNIGSPNSIPALVDNFSFTLKSVFEAGADPNLVPGQTVTIDFEDPNYVAPVPPAPEPGSLLLLGGGALLVLARRRRRS